MTSSQVLSAAAMALSFAGLLPFLGRARRTGASDGRVGKSPSGLGTTQDQLFQAD
jgi:hypothetical protein